MKRTIFILSLAVLVIYSLPAQEMQLSFGSEAAFGVYEVNNDFAFRVGSSGYFLNETTTSVFLAPGLSFSMRVFNDSNTISKGFFFRDRALFMTHITQTGTASINDYSEKINEKYSIKDMDFLISMMDFDMGSSSRIILSRRVQFYTDLGLNFTLMDYEDFETGDTSSYWGVGFFAALSFQFNFSKTVYLELGINSIINVYSGEESTFYLKDFGNREINYRDSGKWDLISSAAYLHIGWRLDSNELRKKLYTGEPE